MTEKTTLQRLKESHSPHMPDEDFLKMLAAANNITMSKNEAGELNVAGDDEIATGGENLITPEQTNQTYLGSWATQNLTETGNIKGIVHDTMDAIGAVVKAPWTLSDKAVSAVEDASNAGLKWFNDDADDISLDFLKSGVTPPRTPLGKIVGIMGEVGIASILTAPAGTAAVLTQGAAKAGLTGAAATAGALLKAGPKTVTGLQVTANALRNAAIDFIVSNPDDKNMAAELQEVIDEPWLAALATQPEDSRIVRRYKHMTDGFVIGELVFPALGKLAALGGKAAQKIVKGSGVKANVTETVPPALAKSMNDFAASIPDFDPMAPLKHQMTEQGIEPITATKAANLIESWAMSAKKGDEPLADFLASRNIAFVKGAVPKDRKGMIDLPAIGTVFTKEAPADITITLAESADDGTIIHELGHLFLHDKFDREVKGLLKDGEAKELAAIKRLIGWKNGQKSVTVSQQEKYADSFVQWFRTGEAPAGMEDTFHNFKNQMADIYEDALETGAELPKEYNSLFGKMLGKADTDPERIRLYQLGTNPEKEAEAIINAGRSKGQAEYGYTVNPIRLTGEDRQTHMRHLTEELTKFETVPDDITRIHHVCEMDALSKEVVNTLVGTGIDGMAMRQQIVEAANASKNWSIYNRACEYMMHQGAEQLAPLYQQLDDLTDETAKIITKGKIYAQLQEQSLYRNAKAQFTAEAARLLESGKHGLTDIAAFDSAFKKEADRIISAPSNPLFKEIPKEALDNGDAETIKQIFHEIGDEKVDAIIQSGKLHMDDLANASMAFDFMQRDWKDKSWDTLKEIYYANLLSNPASWGVNIVSNALKAVVTPLEFAIEGAARYGIGKAGSFLGIEDYVKRLNLDSQYGAETFRLAMNVYNSYRMFYKDAWNIAVRSFKSGKSIVGNGPAFVEAYSPARMLSTEAWGLSNATMGGWALNAIGQAFSIPSRILMSTDQFFKVLAGRGGVYAEVMEDALAKGLSKSRLAEFVDAEMSKRVVQRLTNGQITQELYLSNAVRDFVKEQTFTQDAGAITQAMIKFRDKYPPLFAVFPFIQTPVNIVKDTLAHTPFVAGARLLGESAVNLTNLMMKNQAIVRKGGLARSKLFGQFAIASSLWFTAITLAQDGRITGGGPKNPKARKTKEDLGWQAHSIRLGDAWHRYDPLDPFGTVLAIAADTQEAVSQLGNEEKDVSDWLTLAGVMTVALANNLGDKTYLRTLGGLLNAFVNDPDNMGRHLTRIASDIPANLLIPRVATNAARDVGISDPYMKEVRGCLDAFINRIPGLSDTLPTQYSWLTGKPREYSPYSSINRFTTKSVESKVPDRLKAELLELDQVISGPSDRMNGQKLTGEQYSRYCQLNATVTIADKTLLEALDEAIHSPRYADGDSDEKAKILRSTIGHYRNAAKIQLIEEYPELGSPEKKERLTSALPIRGNKELRPDLEKLIEYGQA